MDEHLLTYRKLAEKFSAVQPISHSAIQYWVDGKSNPDPYRLVLIRDHHPDESMRALAIELLTVIEHNRLGDNIIIA